MSKLKKQKELANKKPIFEIAFEFLKKYFITLIILIFAGLYFFAIFNSSKTIKVEYFYSPTCNPCLTQERIIDNISENFGEKIEVERYCLQIKAGDEKLCINEFGENKFNSNMEFAFENGVSATPATLIKRRIYEGVQKENVLEKIICENLYNPKNLWGIFEKKANPCS